MRPVRIIMYLFVFAFAAAAPAATRYVPQEYATIQAAVNASNDSDVVVVAQGAYKGAGNRSINLSGKQITVQSTDPNDPDVVRNTVIDCEGRSRGFVFYTGETGSSIIRGFTITNGYGIIGGGLYCYNNSSPSIANCLITANSAVFGGAIACANSKTYPKISNCKITENSASVAGGAIYCNGASPIITSCLVSANSAQDGGAVYSHNIGEPAIINCTISGNNASESGGGLYCYKSSNLVLDGDILWGNTSVYAPDLHIAANGAATVVQLLYCDLRNDNIVCDAGSSVNWGAGNINADPRFADADCRLLKGSSCIDAGNPAYAAGSGETDLDGKPRISGDRIDIGAYELQAPIQAAFEIHPETLNLASNGQWVSGIISSTEKLNIDDIDAAAIVLDGTIKPEWTALEGGKMTLKFSRSEVQSALNTAENEAILNITGKLNDGRDFAGSDTIKIVRPGSKK